MVDTFNVITQFYGAAYYHSGSRRAAYEVTTPTQGSLIINGTFIYSATKTVHELLREYGIPLDGWSSTPSLPEETAKA